MPKTCPDGSKPRYRFSGSGKNRVRLAFCGDKVVERTPWPEGGSKGKSKSIHIPGGSMHELVETSHPGETYECPPGTPMVERVRKLKKLGP